MDKEHTAISRLHMAAELSEKYYQKPLLLAYSGGKDSEVCLELVRRAGIPFEAVHSLTTADAPETVKHVRQRFHELELEGISCEIRKPRYKGQPTSMWSLILQKLMPPTRIVRYCCSILKETAGKNRTVVIGSRAAESTARSETAVAEKVGTTKASVVRYDFDNGDERIIAPCQMKAKLKIHPIVEWSSGDVWGFLRDARVKVNPVYEMGFPRCGCIGCPMAGDGRYEQFRVWPKYENLYRKAFARMLEKQRLKGYPDTWKTPDEVFRWWMEDKNLDGQLDIFGGEIGKEDET